MGSWRTLENLTPTRTERSLAEASDSDRMPSWYAVYTSANRERSVAEQLQRRQIEHFLPLYSSVRRWKDRRVTLQRPLFPGYVFVRMSLRDRLRVLQVGGVARLVGFDGTPAALEESEIEALRRGFAAGTGMDPHPFLTVGRRVRIRRGPFAGVSGVLLKRKGKYRVVISIDLIKRSVALDADTADLEIPTI